MKKVIIVTDIVFWRPGAGHKSRIKALVEYLGNYVELKIVFAGVEIAEDVHLLKNGQLNYEVVFLERTRALNRNEYIDRFKLFLNNYVPDVCIVEFLYLSFVKNFFGKHTRLILDTHDLVSDKAKTYEFFGYQHEQISLDEEIQIFNSFDKVMLIQKQEYQKVLKYLSKDKILLVPHPVKFTKKKIRKKVKRLGFIGSNYLPNKDGVEWFIENVFPKIDDYVELHIYGKVCSELPSYSYTNIIMHGFVESMEIAFSQVDIMINPVRFGAGLKIKNIETLGNGIPLITTSNGAMGITEQIDTSFLVADDSISFLEKLEDLIGSYNKRQDLSDNAHQYIKENFSPSKCFDPLVEAIND